MSEVGAGVMPDGSAISRTNADRRGGRGNYRAGGPAHLFERPDTDRGAGPEDDRQAELHERWFGWGEDWTLEP